MDRRHFLRLLLASPLALQVDVEKLLWVPGQQIVVPAVFAPITFKGAPFVLHPELQRIYFLNAAYLKGAYLRNTHWIEWEPPYGPPQILETGR